jgi:hypothetical protein
MWGMKDIPGTQGNRRYLAWYWGFFRIIRMSERRSVHRMIRFLSVSFCPPSEHQTSVITKNLWIGHPNQGAKNRPFFILLFLYCSLFPSLLGSSCVFQEGVRARCSSIITSWPFFTKRYNFVASNFEEKKTGRNFFSFRWVAEMLSSCSQRSNIRYL